MVLERSEAVGRVLVYILKLQDLARLNTKVNLSFGIHWIVHGLAQDWNPVQSRATAAALPR